MWHGAVYLQLHTTRFGAEYRAGCKCVMDFFHGNTACHGGCGTALHAAFASPCLHALWRVRNRPACSRVPLLHWSGFTALPPPRFHSPLIAPPSLRAFCLFKRAAFTECAHPLAASLTPPPPKKKNICACLTVFASLRSFPLACPLPFALLLLENRLLCHSAPVT